MIYYKYVNENDLTDIQTIPYLDENHRSQGTPEHLQQGYTATDVTAEELQKITNRQSRQYLADTDWYVIRAAEGGPAVPEEIATARAAARIAVAE